MRCPKCGLVQQPGATCKRCGAHLPAPTKTATVRFVPPAPAPRTRSQTWPLWVGLAAVCLIVGAFWIGFSRGRQTTPTPPAAAAPAPTTPSPTPPATASAPVVTTPAPPSAPLPAPMPAATPPGAPAGPQVAPPATGEAARVVRNEAAGAVRALRDLESATHAGVNYQEYRRRLADTRIEVDRYARSAPDEDVRAKVTDAMDLYEYGARVWEASIRFKTTTGLDSLMRAREDTLRLIKDPAIQKCRSALLEAKSYMEEGKDNEDQTSRAVSYTLSMTPKIWGCAADMIPNL